MMEKVVADRVLDVRDSCFQLIYMAILEIFFANNRGTFIVPNRGQCKNSGSLRIHLEVDRQASG